MTIEPGRLVKYREREWVVMPSDDQNLIILRPLGGSGLETTGVFKAFSQAVSKKYSFEKITPATFPLPQAENIQDHQAVKTLFQSARLLLRDGTAPFRSIGHLSVHPRPYQYVPLLMALRQSPVRLLIADDVGVGKTIEALLVARELLDRGEAKRLGILCPPYLCDQWHKELKEKFQIEAELIRAGTVSRLERNTPPDVSIFSHYPYFVASIDLVKGERYRKNFVQNCPDLVLVDEAHGSAQPPSNRRGKAQQQRHQLMKEISKRKGKHLILITATPHSGFDESFRSLLGLLDNNFVTLDLTSQEDRSVLANHFIQRRRADVEKWLGEETPFPTRDEGENEVTYRFSMAYKDFFDQVFDFSRGLVSEAEQMSGGRRRMRYWSALALLRCISSSPAAALAALGKRGGIGKEILKELNEASSEEIDETFEPYIYDGTDLESYSDGQPSNIIETQEEDEHFKEKDRRALRNFASEARKLFGENDNKLQSLIKTLKSLIEEGWRPIIWCRYIATVKYLEAEIKKEFSGKIKDFQIAGITGELTEEERRLKVEEIGKSKRRLIVATDCLSEGINLQEKFDAVIHYDLPWNPNRLEQREGRVDRYGQVSQKIKAIAIYGEDNPVDGAIWEVLIRKAREIRKTLGIQVPLPGDSETVIESMMESLFFKYREEERKRKQLRLFDYSYQAEKIKTGFHEEWEESAKREKESRTRFAQRTIKPDEVAQEIKKADDILGSQKDVQEFVFTASKRLKFNLNKKGKNLWEVHLKELPPTVRFQVGVENSRLEIAFQSPPPEGVSFISRTHPLVESLAELLFDSALHEKENPAVSRTGVIRTKDVSEWTNLFLLRVRYLLHEWGTRKTPSLAEETVIFGCKGFGKAIEVIPPDDAKKLFEKAEPEENVSLQEKKELLNEVLEDLKSDFYKPHFESLLKKRENSIKEAHNRVRKTIQQRTVRIEPQYPPDLLGVLILLPVVGEVE